MVGGCRGLVVGGSWIFGDDFCGVFLFLCGFYVGRFFCGVIFVGVNLEENWMVVSSFFSI